MNVSTSMVAVTVALSLLVAASLAADAQQAGKIARFGIWRPEPACPESGLTPTDEFAAALRLAARGDVASRQGDPALEAPPCIDILLVPGGATLLFSDSPETVFDDGILYRDRVGPGPVRIYLYHVNGNPTPRRFSVVARSVSTEAKAEVVARGLAGPSSNYLLVGKRALERYLGSGAGGTISIPAGGAEVLDAELDGLTVSQGQLVHLILDLELDTEVEISVLSLSDGGSTVMATTTLPVLPPDGVHDRGTFPGADYLIESVPGLPAGTGGGVRRLRIGADPDVTIAGVDATTGEPARVFGNYGVLYQLRLDLLAPDRMALVVIPRGGFYAGAALAMAGEDGGGVSGVPGSQLFARPIEDAVLNGRYVVMGEVSTFLFFMPAGGSSLPIDLLFVPLNP